MVEVVVLVDLDCTPGAVLALVLVVVDDLLMPEGVVMVLVLLALVWLLAVVDDLVIPAGLVVVVFVVVLWAAGAYDTLVVVVFDELLLMVVAAGVVWAWAAKLPATTKAVKKPEKRFMCERGREWVKNILPS